ncbi:unnamed protein product [Enterobius vermicularis]|uniref:Secreted protein n=1 Tax=Enterobius vermicularis TaxID=51028 RepID=A0A0N4VRI2_ENTVE|nr:unnamed protein product [Enterobius vermicularis]
MSFRRWERIAVWVTKEIVHRVRGFSGVQKVASRVIRVAPRSLNTISRTIPLARPSGLFPRGVSQLLKYFGRTNNVHCYFSRFHSQMFYESIISFIGVLTSKF